MKRSTLLGIVMTLAWCACVAALVYWKRGTLETASLNDIGGFLGGATAPVAFIWLILGYVQQGEELRQNTEALCAQERALAVQARETSELVKNAARQAVAAEVLATATDTEARRQRAAEIAKAQPILLARGGSGSGGDIRVNVVNEGAQITGLVAVFPVGVRAHFEPSEVLPSGGTSVLHIAWNGSYPLEFSVQYCDALRTSQFMRYTMPRPFVLEQHATPQSAA